MRVKRINCRAGEEKAGQGSMRSILQSSCVIGMNLGDF